MRGLLLLLAKLAPVPIDGTAGAIADASLRSSGSDEAGATPGLAPSSAAAGAASSDEPSASIIITVRQSSLVGWWRKFHQMINVESLRVGCAVRTTEAGADGELA